MRSVVSDAACVGFKDAGHQSCKFILQRKYLRVHSSHIGVSELHLGNLLDFVLIIVLA